MNSNFNRTMDFILKWEGYKSENPLDTGGRTIFGVAEKFHPEVVARIWDMPKDEAKKEVYPVYKSEYWDKCGCDDLTFPYDMIMMDTAVNMGVGRALEFKGKARGGTDFPVWVDFLMLRIEFYCKIAKNNPVFLRGWINRVNDLYATAIKKEEHPLSKYKEGEP